MLLLVAVTRLSAQSTATTASSRYRDSTASVDERVRDLLGRMTLDEKFWQLFMIPGDLDDSTHDYRSGIFGLQVRLPAGTRARAKVLLNIQNSWNFARGLALRH